MINYIPRKFTVIRDKEFVLTAAVVFVSAQTNATILMRTAKPYWLIQKIALRVIGVLTFVLQVRFA